MKKYALFAAALAVAPSLAFSAPVFADSPGQLSNATTNYEVKNVTTGGAYAQSANATCGETVKYSVLLANSDFGRLTDLTVKANLSTGAINASATNTASETTNVSGNVTVNLSNGTLNYLPGTTVRFNGATPTALADGVTSNGVNAGILDGSTQTFVQFNAKVVCETVTPPVTPPVTPVTPVTPTTPKTPATPQVLAAPAVIASTGPASAAITMLGLGSLAAAATYYVRSRRNILG